MGKAKAATRDEFSLLETRGGTFVKDWFDSLKIKDGFVRLDDLPAGDYSLKLDVVQPKAESDKPRPVIVFIHGGGWQGGNKRGGIKENMANKML